MEAYRERGAQKARTMGVTGHAKAHALKRCDSAIGALVAHGLAAGGVLALGARQALTEQQMKIRF